MKKVPFKQARFITSKLEKSTSSLPPKWKDLPEIAIVGRSNVGKSSLLNHLVNIRSLAKVSSTPGKTGRINYFFVDEKVLLVDLPGYGYAQVAQSTRRTWAHCLESYFQTPTAYRLLLFLLDIRHVPSKEDIALFDFASFHQIPFLLILTKTDKLKQKEREKQACLITQTLGQEKSSKVLFALHYSVKDGRCRRKLIEMINGKIWD